jgi:hypothetical protein
MPTNEERRAQAIFIRKYIQQNGVCSIENYDNETYSIEKVSPAVIRDILLYNFTSGYDMEAVSCFIDNLFIQTNPIADLAYIYDFNLKKEVKKWLIAVSKMATDSQYGDVYFSSILAKDVRVLIKTFKKDDPKNLEADYNNMVREYFVGIYAINKLRHIVPNYMYTLGMFSCSIRKEGKNVILCDTNEDIYPFMAIEELKGDSVNSLLKNKKITFDQWLGIFIQLLVALEVGQREIGFCHYDLHAGNVLCRKIEKEYKYSVNLDNTTYDITSECIPTIIDFGMTTVKFNNGFETINIKTIFNYSVTAGGSLEHILHSGTDMFRFLVHSYMKCDFKKEMIKLFDFFSEVNPYQQGDHITHSEIDKADDEHSGKIYDSELCKLTPKMFLNWIIMSDLNYSKTISVKPRDNYIVLSSLNLSTSLSTYDIIFSLKSSNLKNFMNCLKNKDYTKSYILSKYVISILDRLEYKNEKKRLETQVEIHKTQLINNDKKLLSKFKEIQVGPYYNINLPPYNRKYATKSHYISFFKKSSTNKKNKMFKEFEVQYNKFFKNNSLIVKIEPYLQFLYTIYELELEELYDDFLNEFLTSAQYNFYSQNIDNYSKDSRWLDTLDTEIRAN